MEWLLILTIKYHGYAIAITSIKTPSVKSCNNAGSSWAKNTTDDIKFIRTSFTCSPMIKDK